MITYCLPPEISQYFSKDLLATPMPDFGRAENSLDLWKIYEFIKGLEKKTENYPIWNKKFLLLESKFLELYERVKIKEEERIQEKDHKTQQSFYTIGSSDRPNRRLYAGLKWRAKGWRCLSVILR